MERMENEATGKMLWPVSRPRQQQIDCTSVLFEIV
jgi:hypothetical protein